MKESIRIQDIDHEADALEEFLSKWNDLPRQESNGFELQRISHQSFPEKLEGKGHPLAINNFVGRVSDLWQRSLPLDLDVRSRVVKDLLIQQAAADVALASIVLRPLEPLATDEESAQWSKEGSHSQENEVALAHPLLVDDDSLDPSQAPQSPNSPSMHSSLPVRRFASTVEGILPTPEATPSIPSVSTSVASSVGEIYSRLARYTSVEHQTIFPSRPLQQTLAHWVIGADPATYDHESALRRIINLHADEEERLAEIRRKKLQRKMQRHLKRQRRETDAGTQGSSQVGFTSQAQLAIRSSPGITGLNARGPDPPTSSQFPPTSQILPASQVERGLHGGRQRKRQKSRKQGF
jgi:RNA polymerase I-specific transcription initiation factor RRN6